jgi:hypothetical protein
MHVLSVGPGGVSHVVAFHAGNGMFEKFGLAPSL